MRCIIWDLPLDWKIGLLGILAALSIKIPLTETLTRTLLNKLCKLIALHWRSPDNNPLHTPLVTRYRQLTTSWKERSLPINTQHTYLYCFLTLIQSKVSTNIALWQARVRNSSIQNMKLVISTARDDSLK